MRPTVTSQTQVGTSISVAVVARNAVKTGPFRSHTVAGGLSRPMMVRTGSPGLDAAQLDQCARSSRDDEDTAWGYSPPMVASSVPDGRSAAQSGGWHTARWRG